MLPNGYPVPEQQLVRPSVPQPSGAGKGIGEPSLRVDVVEQDPDFCGAPAESGGCGPSAEGTWCPRVIA